MRQRTGRVLNYEPTQRQIAAACAAIRATWTPQERLDRLRADQRPTYTRCDGITEEIHAFDYIGHHDARERLQEADR